jgi:methylmalonyl-CoA mutase N-terminal domain/subunit
MAAVLGGTQSLHTNSFDEALGLPTAESARLALRTQQILAFESGMTHTVDPLAGSYFIEELTNELEAAAREIIAEVAKRGGAVKAIEMGWTQGQIEESAYAEARRQEAGESVVVGVNRFSDGEAQTVPLLAVDPALEADQIRRLQQHRLRRENEEVEQLLRSVEEVASGEGNLLYPLKDALAAGATVGECSDALRSVFGTHRP